jgi:hypothetical protein
MTNADIERQQTEPQAAPEVPTRTARVVQGTKNAVERTRTSADAIIERAPGAAHATWAGARRTTSGLQRLPDSTLSWLAAASVGLAAGLKLAGAPRLVAAAGAAPALIIGTAIALRPNEPAAAEDDAEEESERVST